MHTALTLEEILVIANTNDRIKSLKRGIRELQFTRAFTLLEDKGRLQNCEHIGENVWAGTLNYVSWAALASKLAAELPGIVMPTRNGIIWICGANGPHGVILSNQPTDPDRPEKGSAIEQVIQARSCCFDAGLEPAMGWTMGGICKRILKYIAEPVRPSDFAETLVADINPGYFRCIPGRYAHAELYDVKSYYYTMTTMLDNPKRSLDVKIGQSTLAWQPWKDGERERFQHVVKAIKDCKGLRNALVGSMQGSIGNRVCYTRGTDGKARSFCLKGRKGPFRNLGLLFVRTGYELTKQEALTNNAVYGIIDSVMLTQGKPRVWESRGFRVERQQSGPAHVVSKANYQIGFETKSEYRQGYRTEHTTTGDEPERFNYSNEWL